MSVVGKSTCSGFKTGLYISYHGGNAVRYIKQMCYFMKDPGISGYFDTKYMTVLRIEQTLHNFEDQKFANFFNLEQVNFRVTLVSHVNLPYFDQSLLKVMHSSVNCFLTKYCRPKTISLVPGAFIGVQECIQSILHCCG